MLTVNTCTVPDALRFPIAGKNVLIIGLPASGKTWFSGQLSAHGHKIFHTDDYLKNCNGVNAMYQVLGKVVEAIENQEITLVEGIAGYRMLRKGAQLGCYYPDIVFEIIRPEEQRYEIYRQERTASKIKNLPGFCKAQGTILSDYFNINNLFPPVWIRVINETT